MSLQRYLSVRRSFFIMIIGLVVFVLYLYFFVGVQEILVTLQSIDYLQFSFFYSLSIAAALFSMLLFSMSWQRLLNSLSIKISLKRTFQYHSVGYFIDLVVPCQTICGEVTRVYLAYKEAKESYGRIFASATVNSVLSNSVSVFALLIGAFLILQMPDLLPGYLLVPIVFVIAGIVTYNAIVILVATRREAAEKFISSTLKFVGKITSNRFKLENTMAKVQGSLLTFESGFKMFGKKPQHLLVPLLLLSAAWLSSFLAFTLVFYALNYRFLSFSFFLVAFSLMILVQGAAATFSVGPLDILMTNFFVFYGVTLAAGGVAMLLIRLIVFWIPIFVGYMMIEWLGARSLLSTSKQKAES